MLPLSYAHIDTTSITMISFRCYNTLTIGISLLLAATAFVPQPFTARKRASVTQQFSTAESVSTLPEGLLKTVSKIGNGKPLRRGDVATVKYTCYLPDESKKIPFAKSSMQKVSVGDLTMVEGWNMAVRTMEEGERAIVRINNPELAYGSDGVPPIIPPNAPIEFDIEILEVAAPLNAEDLDMLGFADPLTPRTAGRISETYDQKMAIKALEPQKEGLAAWIETVQNYYFFGFFEGETGEQAPWFLRPSITFPIAFLIVGATFAVSYFSGAITERGAPSTDELDQLITSAQVLSNNPSTLLALMLASVGVSDGSAF